MRLKLVGVLLLMAPRLAHAQDVYARAADPEPRVRGEAALELSSDLSPTARALLITLLTRDQDETVRATAARALAQRGDASLSPLLEFAAAQDRSPVVRAAAAQAYDALWPLTKRPKLAGGFSLLCPGCGHFYLRRPGVAATYLATSVALVGGGLALLANNGAASSAGTFEPKADPEDPLALPLLIGGQNLWFYSVFDAYRDARQMRGDSGYELAITDESLSDLASAPFRPEVVSRPWVWAAVPLALAAGLGLSAVVEPESFRHGRPSIFEVDRVNFLSYRLRPAAGFALGELYYGSLFVPVGVGEEALFRGFVQAELTEAYGPRVGLVVGSLLFGAVHVFNFLQPGMDESDAWVAVPYITLVGSLLGLAYTQTGYRLETSVAMHFWYDFLLGTASFIMDPENQPFVVNVGMVF